MSHHFNRRHFLSTSAYAVTGLALGLSESSCVDKGAAVKKRWGRRLRKAVIAGKPSEDVLKKVKGAGFDGVEAGIVSRSEAVRARDVAARLGLRIHSVMRGWAKFNSGDNNELERSFGKTVDALYAGEGYGADAVLLVPCRIDSQPIPQSREFRIKFDKKTGQLTGVTEDDDGRYGDYIAAHNHAYETSATAIRRLIPIAEQTGVVIGIENVWNNLFVDPCHLAHFIDSFESPWVRAYFDIGNHVKYSRPEEWIKILGRRIVKCHVKDFKLNPDGRGGRFVNIGEGSVNWPLVINALKDIGYGGWMTIEGSEKLSMEERSRRLDVILAGKCVENRVQRW